MKYTLFLFFISLAGLPSWATSKAVNFVAERGTEKFYNAHFIGERDLSLYFDSFHPQLERNYSNAQLYWSEVDSEENYINNLTSRELFVLQKQLEDSIAPAEQCSPVEIGRFQDYMRYLYRLVTMSYLYEVLIDNHQKLKTISAKTTCEPNKFVLMMKTCSPKSNDMISFFKNLKQMNYMQNNSPSKMNKIKNFNDLHHLIKDSNNEDMTIERLKSYCIENKLDCTSLTQTEFTLFLNRSCQQDMELFSTICNENDQLFGLSEIPHAYDLLLQSNASQVLSRHVDAPGCFRRWADLVSNKEKIPYQLPLIFPLVSMHLERDQLHYKQGRLFIAGALREFEEKGLGQIFSHGIKKVEITKAVPEKVKVAQPVVPTQVSGKIKIVSHEPVVKEEVVDPVVEMPAEKVIKKSAFITAYEDMLKLGRANNYVDMVKFRYDFIFSFKMMRDLREPLKAYTSIDALKEMKNHDKLGTIDGPVPLTFVKYLIDTNQHHGLFNVVSILSHRFYVFNDIDEELKKSHYLIMLKNDQSTQLRWEILTVKE